MYIEDNNNQKEQTQPNAAQFPDLNNSSFKLYSDTSKEGPRNMLL